MRLREGPAATANSYWLFWSVTTTPRSSLSSSVVTLLYMQIKAPPTPCTVIGAAGTPLM